MTDDTPETDDDLIEGNASCGFADCAWQTRVGSPTMPELLAHAREVVSIHVYFAHGDSLDPEQAVAIRVLIASMFETRQDIVYCATHAMGEDGQVVCFHPKAGEGPFPAGDPRMN